MRPLLPPPIQALLTGTAMWASAHSFPQLQWQHPTIKMIALLCAGVGLAIEFTALIAFFKAKTTINPLTPQNTQHLLTNGLYRFSRNPMYLGLLLLLSGWALYLGNPINMIWLTIFIVVMTWLQIKPEESALKQLFGESYKQYCAHVRRWL